MTPRTGLVAVLLATALAAPIAGDATAQISRGEQAIQDRQLRAIRNRAVTDPAGAARDAASARRGLVRDNEGAITFGPQGQRIDRQLRALERQPVVLPPRGTTPAAPDLREPGLPSSLEPGPDGLPGIGQTISLVGRLLDRAEVGIGEGRASSARSDLVAAEQGLAGLSSLEAAQPLARRAQTLRSRLGE